MARRKTHEEFVNDVEKLYPNNEYVVIEKYVDSKTKIMIQHTFCGHIYPIKPTLFLNGAKCTNCSIKRSAGKRKSQTEFDEDVFAVHGNEYTFLEKYINARTKLLCRHNVCGHEWMVQPQSFLNRTAHCPMCASNRQKTNEEFIKEVFDLVGNEYTFLEEYIDNLTKLKVRHNICGKEYSISPNMFLSRKCKCLCTSYVGINKKSNEQFLFDLYDVWGNEYTPLDEYTGALIKMWFLHNKCGEKIFAKPNMLLNGHGCRACGIQSFADRIRCNTEEYKIKVKNKFSDMFEVIDEYVNSTTKIKIKCNICSKILNIIPSDFLTRDGCPRCSQSKGEKRIDGFLLSNNIKFKPEKTFDDLFGINGGKLRFDFYIPLGNIAIEYNGQFHDGTVSYQKKDQLLKQQEHDRRKREYCKNKNIHLIEIWYWDFDNIENILKKELKLA